MSVCCTAVKVKDAELEQEKKIDEYIEKIKRAPSHPDNILVT